MRRAAFSASNQRLCTLAALGSSALLCTFVVVQTLASRSARRQAQVHATDLPRLNMLFAQRAHSARVRALWRAAIAAKTEQQLKRSFVAMTFDSSELHAAVETITSQLINGNERPLSRFSPTARREMHTLMHMHTSELLRRSGVSISVAPMPGLAQAMTLLVADMSCMDCGRRAITPQLLLAPPVRFVQLLADFAQWAGEVWGKASLSAAQTLAPDEEPSVGPDHFTVHRSANNLSLTRLATGESSFTLLDDMGNEYVLAQEREATMHADATLLNDIVVAVVAAAAGGVIAMMLGQTMLLGYLVAGTIAGPHCLELIQEVIQTEALAQLGLALLLFVLGAELDFGRLASVRHVAVYGGLAQQALTIVLAVAISVGAGLELRQGVFIGLYLCMASTAVVLRCLQERHAVESQLGVLLLAVLLVQDVSLGVFLGLLPVLRSADQLSHALLHTTVALTVFGAVAYLAARHLLAPLLRLLDSTASAELRALCLFSLCLACVALTEHLGLSVELGAFAGGVALASAPRASHSALAHIEPLRDVFSAFFFFAIGLVIDPSYLLQNFGAVVFFGVSLFLLKFLVAAPVLAAFNLPLSECLQCSVSLAHIGEFGFVLASKGRSLRLLDQGAFMLMLGTTAFSLCTAPYLLSFSAAPANFEPLLRLLPRKPVVEMCEVSSGMLTSESELVGLTEQGRCGGQRSTSPTNSVVSIATLVQPKAPSKFGSPAPNFGSPTPNFGSATPNSSRPIPPRPRRIPSPTESTVSFATFVGAAPAQQSASLRTFNDVQLPGRPPAGDLALKNNEARCRES